MRKFFNSQLAGLLIWMGIIFYFSSMQGNTPVENPPIRFFVIRKGAHIGEYFILMLLSLNYFKNLFLNNKARIFIFSGLLSLTYAFSDEFHQLFVYGREGKIRDVGFDLIGIILAGVIGWFWMRRKK